MMNNEQKWIEIEAEILNLQRQLEEINKQRKEISKKIHVLKCGLNQHNKKHREKNTRTDTEVFAMFGKPLKELTKDEYRIYYNTRQKINRQKRRLEHGKNKSI